MSAIFTHMEPLTFAVLVIFAFMIIGIVTTIHYIHSILVRTKAHFEKEPIITARDLEPHQTPAKTNRPKSYDEPAIQVKSRVLTINYTDGDGKTTIRKIKTASYKPKAQLLFAHCYLAEEQRTFRIDRINSAIDSKNQPIPNVMAYLASIHRDT